MAVEQYKLQYLVDWELIIPIQLNLAEKEKDFHNMFFIAFLVSVFIILHTLLDISLGWSIFLTILVLFGASYCRQ